MAGLIDRRNTRSDPKTVGYPNQQMEVKDEEVMIMLAEAGNHIQEVLCNLGNASYVELREPTLNDVFLQLTGKEIRAEGAESVEAQYARVNA